MLHRRSKLLSKNGMYPLVIPFNCTEGGDAVSDAELNQGQQDARSKCVVFARTLLTSFLWLCYLGRGRERLPESRESERCVVWAGVASY